MSDSEMRKTIWDVLARTPPLIKCISTGLLGELLTVKDLSNTTHGAIMEELDNRKYDPRTP